MVINSLPGTKATTWKSSLLSFWAIKLNLNMQKPYLLGI